MRLVLVSAFALFVAGCSSSGGSSSAPANKAPIVDDLQMPQAVAADATGNFVIVAPISYHDEDGTVDWVRMVVPLLPATNREQKIATNKTKSGTGKLQLTLSGVPKGTAVEIDVSVLDNAGLESAVLKTNVTLQ